MFRIVPLVGLSLLAAAAHGSGRAIDSGALRGSVTSAESHVPVAWANVILIATKNGAMTDSTGTFSIRGIRPGRYAVKVQAVGYKTTIDTLSIPAAGTAEHAFRMSGGVLGRYDRLRDSLTTLRRWPMRLDSALDARLRSGKRISGSRLADGPPPDAATPDRLVFQRLRIVGARSIPLAWRDSLLAALDVAEFAKAAAGFKPLCGCQADVGVRVLGEGGRVDILICYSCELFIVCSDGVFCQGGCFGPGGETWFHFAQDWFPSIALPVAKRMQY